MTTVYFKTTAPEIINAVNEFINKRKFIQTNAENFAKEYGEVPAMLNCAGDTYFAGLKWNGSINDFYEKYPKSDWVFNKKLSYFYPRSKKGLQTMKQWIELRKQHHLYEHTESRASMDIILSSLGGSMGDFLFHGIGWFYFNDTCYFGTSNIPLFEKNINRVQEITGREYDTALKNKKDKVVKDAK